MSQSATRDLNVTVLSIMRDVKRSSWLVKRFGRADHIFNGNRQDRRASRLQGWRGRTYGIAIW